MTALQVRDFPADLYEELRSCAREQDRSLSQQTVHILREYLQAYGQAKDDAELTVRTAACRIGDATDEGEGAAARRTERRRKTFEEIDALPVFAVPEDFPEPAELVRDMREERDGRLASGLEDKR